MMPMITDYMLIWFFGSILINLPIVGNSAIRARATHCSGHDYDRGGDCKYHTRPDPDLRLIGFRMKFKARLATVIANAASMIAGLYVRHAQTHALHGWRIGAFQDSVKRLGHMRFPPP